MRLRFGYLGACLWLAACGVVENSRYRDTSALEKPPAVVMPREDVSSLPLTHEAGPESLAEAEANPAPKEDQEMGPNDDAEPKIKKGLGEQAVAISETEPLVLTLRQPVNEAWNTMKRAIGQSNIELTDMLHDKGKLYVGYDADAFDAQYGSFLEKTIGLVNNEYFKKTYILTLTAEGSATKITAVSPEDEAYRQDADNDNKKDKDETVEAVDDEPTDGADKLLRALYFMLRDELRDD